MRRRKHLSDEICKRAAHPGSKLNQKIVVVGRACACVCLQVAERLQHTYRIPAITMLCSSKIHGHLFNEAISNARHSLSGVAMRLQYTYTGWKHCRQIPRTLSTHLSLPVNAVRGTRALR